LGLGGVAEGRPGRDAHPAGVVELLRRVVGVLVVVADQDSVVALDEAVGANEAPWEYAITKGLSIR